MIGLDPRHSKWMTRSSTFLALTLMLVGTNYAQTDSAKGKQKIVLVAGESALVDTVGHHDYLAGCAVLETLLRQTNGVETVQVKNGWPDDETVLRAFKWRSLFFIHRLGRSFGMVATWNATIGS